MKKRTVSIIMIILVATLLSLGSFELLSGSMCQLSPQYLCMPWQVQVDVTASHSSKSVDPNEVDFQATIDDYRGTKFFKPSACFNKQWDFGDGRAQKMTWICSRGDPLPTDETDFIEQYSYNKSGTYKASVKLYDDAKHLITKSNTLTVKVPITNN